MILPPTDTAHTHWSQHCRELVRNVDPKPAPAQVAGTRGSAGRHWAELPRCPGCADMLAGDSSTLFPNLVMRGLASTDPRAVLVHTGSSDK